MHTSTIAVVTLVLVGVSSMPVQAQGDPAPPATTPESGVRVVGSFGLGLGSKGGAGLVALSLRTGDGDFIARSAGTFGAFTLLGPTDDVTDFALLYGRLLEDDDGWIRFAAGPAYVEILKSGGPRECVFFLCAYEIERSTSLGIALQAEGALRPRRTVGVGISGFANLNGKHAFVGGVVTLHIGRVSRHASG